MAHREGKEEDILAMLAKQVADVIMEMEIGSKTSISCIVDELLSAKGYESKHLGINLGYCWTKDSGITYLLEEEELFDVLYQVEELLQDKRELDFSEFENQFVGLLYDLPFVIRDAE